MVGFSLTAVVAESSSLGIVVTFTFVDEVVESLPLGKIVVPLTVGVGLQSSHVPLQVEILFSNKATLKSFSEVQARL